MKIPTDRAKRDRELADAKKAVEVLRAEGHEDRLKWWEDVVAAYEAEDKPAPAKARPAKKTDETETE